MPVQQNSLEILARASWHLWGDGYALFTRCSSCGDCDYCRGKRRDFVLCLTCFDQRGVS